jgi:hypothetical protein
MNHVNEKIDINEFKNGREFDCNELMQYFNAHKGLFWSWGPQAFTNIGNYCLRFKVNGHHHKGHVYIALNGLDLFDVYLTTTQGTIQQILNDVHIEDLFRFLDEKIERLPEYLL